MNAMSGNVGSSQQLNGSPEWTKWWSWAPMEASRFLITFEKPSF